MARARSQPKPVFNRVQSRQNRNAVRPYQTLIEKFYIQDGRELKWIMQYMKEEKGIDLSVKQYKSQLKTWGLRHKLTRRDAAFILRLLNQARREGRPEVVVFSGHLRRREDIEKYITRNEKLVDENHLLSCISDKDDTPPYIRLQAPELGRSVTPQLPPTPPSGSPTSSANSEGTPREISPMRVQISSPLTPRSSGEFSAADGAAAAGAAAVLRHSSRSNARLNAEHIHALASETPAVVDQLSDLDFGIYRYVIGQIHSRQLHDGSLSANFVMYCMYWLVFNGQDDATFQSKGDEYLDSAMFAFLCMLTNVRSPAEECLGALSVVAALFDCYGQQERLRELLSRCDGLTKKHYGSENPLTVTIDFMGKMLAGPSCPEHDILQLTQVVVDMYVIFPQSPKPALTARYHLAWAKLENELKKKVRNPKNFEPIRQEFRELAKECEIQFGSDRIETIMAYATCARATFWCGLGVEAESILSLCVMPRVRQNFAESHPYVWEAKHRQAYFLFQLARTEAGSSRLPRLQAGEQLLREVVPARYRVLGESNRKTKYSVQLLRDILKEQGRGYEAETLSEWCEREVSR
ncbi:hypothetical protein H2200_005724 [Cladophialophora chaetospira]|uniref:Clr5 domain-containing protein n=1 Tax=Cladophialophora chaetospira TaxID=386627 RepID=A0AA38X9K9_9EURO|nr:hypothetical protein H2200_005724 [Cladophialophora chaetospira]